MKYHSRILIAVAAVLLVLVLSVVATIVISGSGRFDARNAISENEGLRSPSWLQKGEDNACGSDPCLVVEHWPRQVYITLQKFDEDRKTGDVQLLSRVTLENNKGSLQLIAQHDPTPSLESILSQQGVDIDILQKEQKIFAVSGMRPFTNTVIELPYGVIGPWFFDAFRKIDRAMGNKTDDDYLRALAETAANEVSRRFGLFDLAEKAWISQIAFGPIQSLTYTVALVALVLTGAEAFEPRLRKISDVMADLIPFTGFFGTLIGVSISLRHLGQADITDDISKALILGRMGSGLTLAIYTTILAIVIFGLVLVTQYAVRSLLASRNADKLV